MRGDFVQPLVQLPLVGRGRLGLKGKQTATSLVPRPCCPHAGVPQGHETPHPSVHHRDFPSLKSRPSLGQPLGTGSEWQDRAHALQVGRILVSEWGLEMRRRRASVMHHFQGSFATAVRPLALLGNAFKFPNRKKCSGDRKGRKQGRGAAEAREG